MDSPYKDVRRARVVCLTGIVIISVGLGFVGGRVSAWLIPIGGNSSLSTSLGQVAADPPRRHPVQSDEGRKANKSTETVVRADDAIQVAPEKSSNEHDGTARAEETPDRAQGSKIAEWPEERRLFGATVVNAGSELQKDRAASGQERSDTADSSTAACARRYASFRESDGTYQPYDSSQRRRCPLLR